MLRAVAEENDPEVLRAYLDFVLNDNNRLTKELEKLRTEKERQAQQRLATDDQLLTLKKRMFGKSSERRSDGRSREKEDRQLLLHSKRVIPSPNKKELSNLAEITVDHKLTDKDLKQIAKEYGYPEDSEWELIEGLFDNSRWLALISRPFRAVCRSEAV